MKIVLVAAVGENGVIGRAGQLPWRLKSDLAHFRALTIDRPVIMGRKTFQSIGRPLDRRTNIVVTRQAGWSANGAVTASSLDDALDKAGNAADVMVIGGGEIYRAALTRADRIELTEVHGAFDGDAHFVFERASWRETARESHTTPDGLSYSYVTLTRR